MPRDIINTTEEQCNGWSTDITLNQYLCNDVKSNSVHFSHHIYNNFPISKPSQFPYQDIPTFVEFRYQWFQISVEESTGYQHQKTNNTKVTHHILPNRSRKTQHEKKAPMCTYVLWNAGFIICLRSFHFDLSSTVTSPSPMHLWRQSRKYIQCNTMNAVNWYQLPNFQWHRIWI